MDWSRYIGSKPKNTEASSDTSVVGRETKGLNKVFGSISETLKNLPEYVKGSSTTILGGKSSRSSKGKERESGISREAPVFSPKVAKEKDQTSFSISGSRYAVGALSEEKSHRPEEKAHRSEENSDRDAFERDWSSEDGWTFTEINQDRQVRPQRLLDPRPLTAEERQNWKDEFRSSAMVSEFCRKSPEDNLERLMTIFAGLVERPEAVATMRTYGVSIVEAVAIFVFVDKSEKFNDALRKMQSDDKPLSGVARTVIGNLRGGLSKLPRFQGDLHAVRKAEDEDIKTLKEGKLGDCTDIINSFSRYLDEAALKERNLHIIMKPSANSTAADVSMFCRFPDDGEVLILPEDGRYRLVGWRQEHGYIQVLTEQL